MDKREVKRRAFLKVSATAVLGAVAAACQTKEKIVTQIVTQQVEKVVQQTVQVETTKLVEATKLVTQEKQVQVTVEVQKGRGEVPFLQAKVASGELPPVDERLPENPVVVGGRDAIGVYGGAVTMMHFDPVWMTSNYDLNAERCFHYSDIDLRTIVPNIFESWQVTPDGKEWTITLRKGVKYSDGQPLTTEDVRFFWEDFWLNTDLNASVPWQFRFGGANMKVDIIDDFNFKITFAAPYGNFAAQVTRMEPNNNPGIFAPSHYLKQFLPKYTDQATLDATAKALKMTDWKQLAGNRIGQWGCGVWRGDDWILKDKYPVLSPWMIVSGDTSSGLFQLERNPYYWKVDLAGNQLPYLDTFTYIYSATTDNTMLMVAQGQLDIVGMHDVTVSDYPLYKENEAKGNFNVGDYISCMGDRFVLFPNHYVVDDKGNPDTVLNDIVNNPNWVRALSMAIDRSEVNDSLYYGLATVGQLAPMPSSKYYKPKYGEAYATFDVDGANKLLDDMGLTQKDSNGIRLRSDGKPLSYMIEHAGARVGPAVPKYVEMVITYWRALGIDASGKEMTEALYNSRMQTGQTHCGIWHADRCTDLLLHIEPEWYIPTRDPGQGGACWAWCAWFLAADRTDPKLVQPPDEIKALYGYFDQMTAVVSEDERVQWGQKLFDYLADKPLEIGLVLECPAPLLFNKNLRNLPRPKVIMGWDTYGQSTYHPEAYFFEGGKRFEKA